MIVFQNSRTHRDIKLFGCCVGDCPYTQNIPESVNDLIKDWNNFKPQEMDKLILSLYDVVQSFNEEEELAWFGLSEKWNVREKFQHLRPPPFTSLSPDERKAEMTKVRRIWPDAAAYRECKSLKFQSRHLPQTEANEVKVGKLLLLYFNFYYYVELRFLFIMLITIF